MSILRRLKKVAGFAGLGALVLHGNSGMNTGLPLTDSQKARQQQSKEREKEREKKRAAAVQERHKALDQNQQPPQQTAEDTAKAIQVLNSADTAKWANR